MTTNKSNDIKPKDWWMFHGDRKHSGNAANFDGRSDICAANVKSYLKTHLDVYLGGSILSTPAIVKGFVYVGTANSDEAQSENGGKFFKINIENGEIAARFTWNTNTEEGDSHGFFGMGCTPAVVGGRVFFSAFDGKFYCLDADSLEPLWVTNLRYQDFDHNQPVDNSANVGKSASRQPPPAAGWSSPVVVGDYVYVGFGEGENPDLYGYVYCLNAQTGNVVWLYCTCQFEAGKGNPVNTIPADAFPNQERFPGFSAYHGETISRGCSIWSSIAYSGDLKRLYCATGNPVPDSALPSAGFSNGILSLDATTGKHKGFIQMPADSSYRRSDMDVDIGGSPTVFKYVGTTVVGIACKNGSYMIVEADNLQILTCRQLLPYMNNGDQIPSVDVHIPWSNNSMTPAISNEESNNVWGENLFGSYSTAAVYNYNKPDGSAATTLFVGMGGNNYHNTPGIDTPTTPFMRAVDSSNLNDAWPLDDHDPKRYLKCRPPMYTKAAESALSYPAVVNDVVFCSTSYVALYAFDVKDGTPLWQDQYIGAPTGGMTGGYGYCLGPAIWGNYVVIGALIAGNLLASQYQGPNTQKYDGRGGILRIYKLADGAPPAPVVEG